MAWTAPRTWVVGELVTAAIMNTHIRDNLLMLKHKELYVPVTLMFDDSAGTYDSLEEWGDFPIAHLIGLDDIAFISFRCPADFNAITTAKIIVIPRATQANANWDIASDYGAEGEAYNVHSEADAATTYNVVNNQIYGVNISGILTALAAGDAVGIRLTLKNALHDVEVVGIYMIYT